MTPTNAANIASDLPVAPGTYRAGSSPVGLHRVLEPGGVLPQAAWKLDQGAPDATKFCAMAKLHVTDRAFEVANQCLQLHGGYGYLADYGIEKIVRDLRVHQILEGTNEIMRLIVARALVSGP